MSWGGKKKRHARGGVDFGASNGWMFYSFWEGQKRPSELSTEQIAEREMQKKGKKKKKSMRTRGEGR